MDEHMEKPEEEVSSPESPAPEGGKEDLGSHISFHTAGTGIDGTVEVGLSPDSMAAVATFSPPRGEGLPLEPSFVYELLARLGIVSGVMDEEIAQSVLSCNLDRRVLHNVVIAKGTLPVSEIPEHAAIDPRFKLKGPHIADNVQRVDFRELASLIVVRAGDTIATIQPKRPGVPGRDLRGRETPFPREGPESISAGRNVERREDRLVATVDGRLAIEAGRADVDEVLLVKGEVDFHTGHIAFPGDVVIEGAVHDGFKVWSGGSIVCKSTVDAYDVNAKKDLICGQGIIGRRRGEVRVGGELKAKYIQNCRVAARGDVTVAAAVISSRIYTLGSLLLGDKGVLMGGEVFAARGVRCGRLGNQALQPTRLHVGIDFSIQQRLDQANERMRFLTARAREIEQASKAMAEIAKQSSALRNQINGLLSKLDIDEGAIVEARGEVFPGVVIEICRVSIVVEEKLQACRFRLDRMAGRIIVEH